jgi:hypothetical protein
MQIIKLKLVGMNMLPSMMKAIAFLVLQNQLQPTV